MRLARLASLAAVLPAGLASAGPLAVNPVRIDLGHDNPTAVLTLTNPGDVELSYQLHAATWAQTSDGEMELGETTDVVFFPRLFTIGPGASRKVRVGLAPGVGVPDRERTYRLFIEELPQARAAAQAGMHIRVTIGIPIFLAPVKAAPDGEIAALALEHGRLSFAVRATGTAHLLASQVRVVGVDGGGQRVFERATRGSYVLAGGERRFGLALDAGECARARALVVEAATDDGRTLRGQLPLAAAACAR